MDAPSSLPSLASVVARLVLLMAAALLCRWQAGEGLLALTVTALLLALATPFLAGPTPRFTAGLAWGLYAGALAAGLTVAAGFVTWGLLPFALLVSGQSLALMGLAG